MKDGQSLWTKEQLILTINLYSKIPFGQMSWRNKDVQELAGIIGRTPSAVGRKLGNLASFDPKLKERGVKGLENASKLDKEVWEEYMQNWDDLFIESEKLLAKKKNTTVERLNNVDLDNISNVTGEERQRIIKTRVNQELFRKVVMTNYDHVCCITGVNIPELLVASHILPWSKDRGNRINPANGLALNALQDKAFDRGLITIMEDLTIKVSPRILNNRDIESIEDAFGKYDGKKLLQAKKFSPSSEFLKIHNDSFKF